jgi:protein TonB
MMQGGFYERKRMSPGAVGVVILLHGAAITALVMAKEGGFAHVKAPPILIDLIKAPKDPPPKPKPTEPHPQQPEILTRTTPTVKLPPIDPIPQPPKPVDIPRIELPPGPQILIEPPRPLPPPPPPAVARGEPARAKANLGRYVSDADYPSDAIRREEQGATRFRLAVGPDGRVTDCTVIGSSGSAALDLATCRLMKSRARFAPAHDSSGNAVADAVSSSITWRLPNG